MIKLLSVAIVAGLLFAESNQQATKITDEKGTGLPLPIRPLIPGWPGSFPTNIQCWTEWFDRDDPSGTGDWEILSGLRKANPGKICAKPTGIEAETLSGLSVAAAGDVIYKSDTTQGFICRNADQSKKKCNDYRVRFSCHPPFCGGGVCWTRWYDRDNPSGSGDWELLSSLKSENPGEICDYPMYIEAVTTDTATPAIITGETFYAYSPTDGLVCRKKDQKSGVCRDYKVRFGCPCNC
ncbi:cartilage intermediate layer protein 2 [Chaetodon auriga]|uniref:cartilage intermediate layer protein 2 n=1 Tax=Chaetodon auriga TaxID=39042 RepID=UPI004032CFC7